MSRIQQFAIAIFIIGVGCAAFAQGGRGTRNYNPSTEVKVKGTIEQVQQFTGGSGRGGTHLKLKTDGGTLAVHVGPSAYIAKQQFAFAEGDEIEVLGSRTTVGGIDVLLAREINKAGRTLVLRDAQEIPEWAGQRN